jgi:NTP-dependent ternary system trypsin peptidase co-occuring protein
MKQLITVPSSTGGEIVVEVDADHGRPTMRGGGGGAPTAAIMERAAATFEESVAKVVPAAAGLVAQLRAAAEGASEVTVKFGLKFTAEAKVFVAAAGGEATFEVGLKWTDPPTK